MKNYRYWCLRQFEIDALICSLKYGNKRVIYQDEELGTLRVTRIHKPSSDYIIDFKDSPSRLLILLRPDWFCINGQRAFQRELGDYYEYR